jgi:UDP-2,3-diacylglucosamine hydrolase
MTVAALTPFAELTAPSAWGTVELISDLHLQASEPDTLQAWLGYLQTSQADAIFILGDLFEAWVGDDAATAPGFEADCAEALRQAAKRRPERPLFFMHGNRDFLVGQAFAELSGLTLLTDPTVLILHGERWLLSHGDLLCLEDVDYLRFREQVRNTAWQQAFLSRPLIERHALARDIRAGSEAHKRSASMVWADVDTEAARHWLQHAEARTLIHGHTHRPAQHDLGDGLQRIVLSDWDAAAQPRRVEVLRLSAAGIQRIAG